MTWMLFLPLRLLFRLPLRLVLEIKLIILGVLAGMAIAYGRQLKQDHATWGLVSADIERSLPGDDLVADARVVETRSLSVDAPPAAVWPWIVQMGYGRGGWYSFDKLDRPWGPDAGATDGDGFGSADSILPDYQDLAVGDVMPTHPGGGFDVRVVERDRALVLYLDAQMVKRQMQELAADDDDDDADAADFGSMPDFTLSWAFVLEPEAEGRTRLVTRFRASTDESGMPQRLGMPFIGYGVFALTRKQMLGIKERAERAARESAEEAASAG